MLTPPHPAGLGWALHCLQGSYVMATWLFASVYERLAREQAAAAGCDGGGSASDGDDGSGTDGACAGTNCIGAQCFMSTALIATVSCVASWLMCVWLGRRSQERYDALRRGPG